MAIFFQDTFTAGSDEALSAHTPDIGTSWTNLWSGGGADFGVVALTDVVTGNTVDNDGVIYTADTTYATADYDVSIDIAALFGTGATFYLLARLQDQENMYGIRFGSNGSNDIYKKVTGTWSLILTGTAGYTLATTVALRVQGTTIAQVNDGVVVDSVTDADIATAGKGGMAGGGGAELAISTNDWKSTAIFDNFSIATISTGTTGPSLLTTLNAG